MYVGHGHPQLFWKGGGGQDRARGRHLTAAYTLSAFGRFNQWGGGGGGAVHFRPIQPVGGGGGGGCPLSADLTSGGAHVCKQGEGGWGHPCRWVDECGLMDGQMHGHILYSCMYMHTNTPLWLTFSSWFYFLLQC